MSHLFLASICAAVMSFEPPSKNFKLSKWQKKKGCSYSSLIAESSKKHNVDKYVLTALIIVESGLNRRVVSSANACGLTQVIPKYTGRTTSGRKYTCEQLKNPKISIDAGAQILSWWLDYRGRDRERQALCSYNAGFKHCDDRNLKKRRTPAGFRYADRVLKLADSLRAASSL